jgi:hypothetical protein
VKKIRIPCMSLASKFKGRNLLEYIRKNGSIILKWIINKEDVKVFIG